MAKPKVGDSAPDFELDGTEGSFRLSDQRGKRVVLLFYPGDDTPVCTKQFCSYSETDMSELDAVVVGISAQSLESHRDFTAKYGLNVPLLADKGSRVAKDYGAHRRPFGTRRAVVIVDEDGTVAYRHDHMIGIDYQSFDDIQAALRSLPSPV